MSTVWRWVEGRRTWHYAISNKSEKDKYCMISFNVESKKAQRNRVVVTSGGVAGGGNGELSVKEHKLPVIRLTNSGYPVYRMVIIANTISYN